jgi:hypothetical protein
MTSNPVRRALPANPSLIVIIDTMRQLIAIRDFFTVDEASMISEAARDLSVALARRGRPPHGARIVETRSRSPSGRPLWLAL